MADGRMKLHETVEALRQVEAWIDEELSRDPDAEGALTVTLEQLLGQAELDFSAKVANVLLMGKGLEYEAKALRSEAARLAARASSREALQARLKEFVREGMLVAGVDKVKDPRLTVWIQAEADKIEWPGEDWAIPEPYRRAKWELDRTAAKAADPAELVELGFTIQTGRFSVRTR